MKTLSAFATTVTCIFLSATLAFGNPSMLPKHPGYPMGEFKDPVLGVPTANDPGHTAPSPEEALQQAAAFHDAHATNPMKEVRPNVVYEDSVTESTMTADTSKK